MIKNTTTIEKELAKKIIDFCLPDGVKSFDVMIKNAGGNYLAGTAYRKGSSYHSSSRKFVSVRIPRKDIPFFVYPYQYAHLKGKKYFVSGRIEALVYILAHELRHLWQDIPKPNIYTAQQNGYFFGAKGKMSEIDTESYAIHKLRQWRKEN